MNYGIIHLTYRVNTDVWLNFAHGDLRESYAWNLLQKHMGTGNDMFKTR